MGAIAGPDFSIVTGRPTTSVTCWQPPPDGADQEFAGKPLRAQIAFHLLQMMLHQRLQRSVDRGRRSAAIFAHDREQLVRQRVGDAWQLLLDQPADFLLMTAVGDRPQQTNRDGLEFPLR